MCTDNDLAICRRKLFQVAMAMLLLKYWRKSTGDASPLQLCSSVLSVWRGCKTEGVCRRVVERASQEEVTVDYANDLDTKRYTKAFAKANHRISICYCLLVPNIYNGCRYGTGFQDPADDIRTWDLNNLYQQPHSLLAMLDENVEGVTYPWLYFGMLFSTFCWHNEDHFLYSINYMHEGQGKTW